MYLYSASLLFLLYVYIYLLNDAPKVESSRKFFFVADYCLLFNLLIY